MKNVKDAESLAIDILTFLTGISSRDGEKFPVLRKAVRSVTQSDSRHDARAVRRAHHGAAVHAGDAHLRAFRRPGRDAGAGGGVHGRHRLGRPVPDPRDRLHAAYPQPGESGLRDGRAGVRRLDERGA